MADALLKTLLDTVLSHWPILATLLAVLVVVKFIRSPTVKGWLGERQVNRGLRRLDPAHYRCFTDLYLPRPDGDGTTQLDHVVVSPYGIFVIETKNYQGWIFGTEKQAQWTQQIYRHKSKFQNPLHQNALHVKSLAAFLRLPADRFQSVVFFIGDATFKTPMPDNVLNRGLLDWIKAKKTRLLTPPEVATTIGRLSALDQATERKSARGEHLSHLKSRHR
ncbi:MAG: NERD domain-containing protein [Akkermansiaceae bacterium]|nr:NERD domain-containing protein [Akkermansiaceae bacterium]